MTLSPPIAAMNCGHSVEFTTLAKTPARGALIYCIKCREYRNVAHAPAKFTVRCQDCRFSRATYGHVRLTAEGDISKHRARYPEHHVDLYDGLIKEYTFTSENTRHQKLLDNPDSSPPY
jgi:hypothetical protein